jgi:preprotein translocase subunit SecA
MNNRIASILQRAMIPEQVATQQVREAAPEQHSQRYTEQKADADAVQSGGGMQQAAAQDTREGARRPVQPIVKDKMPGRNDPCPCGSGKKFKNCHGRGIV